MGLPNCSRVRRWSVTASTDADAGKTAVSGQIKTGAPARSDGALLGAARVGKVCSIASVSALPAHAADVRAAAEWFVARLTASGFDAAAAHETALHPVVTAEALGADEGAPTLLIYGHFDLQVRILLSALSHTYSVHTASLAYSISGQGNVPEPKGNS